MRVSAVTSVFTMLLAMRSFTAIRLGPMRAANNQLMVH
jgi:hypothetical protein